MRASVGESLPRIRMLRGDAFILASLSSCCLHFHIVIVSTAGCCNGWVDNGGRRKTIQRIGRTNTCWLLLLPISWKHSLSLLIGGWLGGAQVSSNSCVRVQMNHLFLVIGRLWGFLAIDVVVRQRLEKIFISCCSIAPINASLGLICLHDTASSHCFIFCASWALQKSFNTLPFILLIYYAFRFLWNGLRSFLEITITVKMAILILILTFSFHLHTLCLHTLGPALINRWLAYVLIF